MDDVPRRDITMTHRRYSNRGIKGCGVLGDFALPAKIKKLQREISAAPLNI